ncbi:hypothetical protein PQX77_004933 [Marasmius sp. AFHP31]|nr:hypothetical protein PQX77_004933 [Marasmius sp. AFHP31]
MAELDLATGDTQFKNSLSGFFPKAEELQPGFVDEKLLYGLAAMQAHAAYDDKTYISYAETAWGSMNEYTLSDRDVEAGKSPKKSFVLAKGCGGASLAGGTFAASVYPSSDCNKWIFRESLVDGGGKRPFEWPNHRVSPSPISEPFYVSTRLSDSLDRLFMILSSMLAKVTGNQTYLAAAIQSFDFLQSQLRNEQTGLIIDSISSEDCQKAASLIPYNTGLMIEGLSVLVSIELNNETLSQTLQNAVKSVILKTEWTGSTGIMTHAGEKRFNFGLFRKDSHATSFGRLYNAVLSFATFGGSNVYGTSYIGPPGDKLEPIAQAAILPVLISGILLGDTPVTSTTSPTPSPTTGTPVSSKNGKQHSAIIGGVVGGVLFFLLLTGAGLWVLKGRLRKGRADVEGGNPSVVTPYPMGYSSEAKRARDPLNPLKGQQIVAETRQSQAAVSDQNGIRLSDQLIRALEAQNRRDVEDVPPPDYRSNLGRTRRK